MRDIPPEPLPRWFHLKLPLERVDHHWRFRSREDFLAGSLTLRIIREGEVRSFQVFSQGVISDSWRIMGEEGEPGEIYYGFVSQDRFLSAPADSLELELVVVKDLPGWGALIQADLPEGIYVSTGSYTGLTDNNSRAWMRAVALSEGLSVPELEAMPEFQAFKERMDEQVAESEFMAGLMCWRQKWPLRITAEEGWLGPERAATARRMDSISMAIQAARPDMGTDGRPCHVSPPDTIGG
jgi:hypothetical protein